MIRLSVMIDPQASNVSAVEVQDENRAVLMQGLVTDDHISESVKFALDGYLAHRIIAKPGRMM